MFRAYLASVRRVRDAYPPEKRRWERTTDLPAFLLYRPLSLLVTPPFLALGWSANAVTLLGLALALTMPAAAVWGGPRAYAWVVGIAVAFQVLDCVDGNVARVTRTASPVGDMLDGLTTLGFWVSYFVALGALAQAAGGPWGLAAHGREVGLAVALLLVVQRKLENDLDHRFGTRVRWEPPVPGVPVANLGRALEHTVAFGGLLAAGAAGRLEALLALVAGWQVALFAQWLPRYALAVRARAAAPAAAPPVGSGPAPSPEPPAAGPADGSGPAV